jgi:zinc transporter 1
MLAIDITFLVLELSIGVAVSSLALMADAFHMVRKHCLLEISRPTTDCQVVE